ncbi:hypothetical protein J1N35_023248 [Gossypium stocksii]|uniref:Uncharacterized protein n=1 Tax=Gossypium stocksii TaxID=47602 RepID=A0A9D3VJQ3_9ROSI|nr:hypothetical protein J1N35_023248 [Gossypium stocksii]
MKNYNILLATLDSALRVLYSAATIKWDWKAMLEKENLIGKHYNYPADSPDGSCFLLSMLDMSKHDGKFQVHGISSATGLDEEDS